MIVGGYTLDLYCDVTDCKAGDQHPGRTVPTGKGWKAGHASYFGETGSACRKTARRHGWKLTMKDGQAACPTCMKEGKTAP